MRFISYLYLKIKGWKIVGNIPPEIKKAVVIAAPHTSGLDFVLGRCGFYVLGIRKIQFFIKKEMFRFPLGILIRALGAVPVDRGKKNNLVDQITQHFAEKEKFYLLITPEGTRKYTTNWKKGFYLIAMKANVPIVVSFIDYAKKEGGIGFILYPTGDFEQDFKKITDFYKTKTARFPKDFNLSEMYQK